MITIDNHHAPIIPKEVFNAVQREIIRRRGFRPEKTKHSNRYAWSGKLRCKKCGSILKRQVWNGKKTVWRCYGGCGSPAIYEECLMAMFNDALLLLKLDIDKIKSDLCHTISKVLAGGGQREALIKRINNLKNKKERLLELYTDYKISKDEFSSANDKYNSEIEAITKELNLTENIDAKLRTEEINNEIKKGDFTEEMAKRIVQKVEVLGREQATFYFGLKSDDFFMKISITK